MRAEVKERELTPDPITGHIVLGDVPVDNEALAQYLARTGFTTLGGRTVEPWDIAVKTGVLKRYHMQTLGEKPKEISETVPHLATKASLGALEKRSWKAESIDAVFAISSVPFDGRKISDEVSDRLGIRGKNVDIYAACAGGAVFFASEAFNQLPPDARVLAVAADHYSSMLDKNLDLSIFGDGAAAIVFKKGDIEVEDAKIIQDPNDAIVLPINPENYPRENAIILDTPTGSEKFKMDGPAVYKWLVKGPIIDYAKRVFKRGDFDDSIVIPHSGSIRPITFLKSALPKIGVFSPVSDTTLEQIGNPGSASTFAEMVSFTQRNREKLPSKWKLIAAAAGLTGALVAFRLKTK